ncbi:MAG: ribonuclease E activity regulator RraA [Gammaproteobacteria bacterium]|nr:ribonuclease E activity regulator RraA [Gammaproteobacteria bacterium]
MRSTPDLYDDFEDIATTCSMQFRDFGGRKQFSGPIRTVKCRNDNQLFRALMDEPGNGAVAVVDGGGSTEVALIGDIIAAKAARNGWAGIVINGAVRDVIDLSKIDIGIKALGTNPAKSIKKGEGTVDVMLHFGGARFKPGHWIYCDENGVLIAPKALT